MLLQSKCHGGVGHHERCALTACFDQVRLQVLSIYVLHDNTCSAPPWCFV